MTRILPNIEHIVVVMFENRSFDTMLGFLHADGSQPKVVLPAGSPVVLDGVLEGMSNPANAGPPFAASSPATTTTLPDPDPQETFANVTKQLLGPVDGWEPMQGFVVNYQTTTTADASQVMQCHSAEQLNVLSTLARSYAVSDAWFASVPSQTWPNRAFAHAGTSNGHVDNGLVADPLQWDVPTIFNVLDAVGASWSVYSDAIVAPSLTRTIFPSLWDARFNANFQRFDDFVAACKGNTLPQYTFIEPRFLVNPNDQHPPHDINAGEQFLYDIWTAVSTSPGWNSTLLLITYDEHGGCFDHVLPPSGQKAPDARSNPGDENFGFDRLGVRVPFVAVSPWIAEGTVFRSPGSTPYDHTSLLATLRDWLAIAPAQMLSSERIAAAPTLEQVCTLDTPRTQLPQIAAPAASVAATPLTRPLNDLQRSLVSGTARRTGLDPVATLAPMMTRQHAVDFFNSVKP